MAQSRPTIADVAARAGVSIATVSKVINERYGVAPATAEKVREIIDTMGYESSLVARSLRSRRTNVLAVLVTDIEPFSAELLKGAAKALRETPYELIVYVGGGHRTEPEPGWERRSLSRLSGTLADGVILVTPTLLDYDGDQPVVAVDPHTGTSGVPSIVADNLAGAVAATEHLTGLGHTRIGFLGGRPDLESARQREQGYRSALAAAGIAVDEALIGSGGYRAESSVEPARRMLTGPDRPTAVFAANDLSAIETMAVARSLGLRVPEDLSVVGFDNIPESALSEPSLTTVDQSIHQMGAEAIRALVSLIDGAPVARQITLPTRLVVRQSTTGRTERRSPVHGGAGTP
ncbi:MAG: LacI family DNA-binding transcriptional regulator [Actinomycetota bacterium]|nr:LacI family DNA-binding transcriptional regulator [Actinomycetota bacterium]